MNKRLVIISVVGIILIGAVYWYTTRAPEAPPKPPALPRRVTKPRPPKPLTPIEPPERKPKVAKPPVAVAPPKPEEKQPAAPPEEKVPKAEAPVAIPPKVPPKAPSPIAKRPETPRETPKPAEPQAQAEKPAPEPVSKPTVPEVRERGRFSVQVASLVVKRNALSLKKRLEKLGYDPIIQKIKARITSYRVTAGEFRDREAADQTARSLGADGFSPRLVEGDHEQFAVEVGWSFNQNDAIDLARRVEKKGYRSKIVSKTAHTPVYAVRVGVFDKRSEAVPVIKALKRKGFAPVLVGC